MTSLQKVGLIISLVLGAIATALHFINAAREWRRDKVRLRVTGWPVRDTAAAYAHMDDDPMGIPRQLVSQKDWLAGVTVLNLSRFSVTIQEVGFWGPYQITMDPAEVVEGDVTETMDFRGREAHLQLPRELQPRKALTLFLNAEEGLVGKEQEALRGVFVRTLCGHFERATSKRLQQFLGSVWEKAFRDDRQPPGGNTKDKPARRPRPGGRWRRRRHVQGR